RHQVEGADFHLGSSGLTGSRLAGQRDAGIPAWGEKHNGRSTWVWVKSPNQKLQLKWSLRMASCRRLICRMQVSGVPITENFSSRSTVVGSSGNGTATARPASTRS